MALIKCNECGHQISKSASQCPGCGAKIKRTSLFTKIVAIFIALVAFSAILGKCSSEQAHIAAAPSPVKQFTEGVGTPVQKLAQPTELEKAYIGAAGGYLKTQNEQGLKVATAMAGLNTGATTLELVRKAIKDARFVTNMGFEGDYLKSGKLVIPETFSHIDKKVRGSYALRDAAFEEYLKYWKDNNVAHIESGTATFKRSEQTAQEATQELTAQMKVWHK